MAVQIEAVAKTKSGKGLRVKLSGTYYNAFLDSKLDMQPIGTWIEAEIKTHEKFGPYVDGWRPVQGAAPQVPLPQAGSVPPVPPPAVAAPLTREPVYAEPSDNIAPWFMPFVSNTVAHAIEKGLISSPIGINEWALKAAQVAVSVKEAVK